MTTPETLYNLAICYINQNRISVANGKISASMVMRHIRDATGCNLTGDYYRVMDKVEAEIQSRVNAVNAKRTQRIIETQIQTGLFFPEN